MYKLLLISDQAEILDAFAQIDSWELLGFKPPHIRHDFEGAKESLQKHHADGIAIALSPAEEEKVLQYLQEKYPLVSIFQAGRTPSEIIRYLTELKMLLNRVRADFSNDSYTEIDMLQLCRHEFLGKLMAGKILTRETLYRNMQLLRSRLDPDCPCVLMELEQVAIRYDRLEGRWPSSKDRLEFTLRNSLGPDFRGLHIVPTVLPDGKILVLACPLKGQNPHMTTDDMIAVFTGHVADNIEHLKEYKGVDLHMVGIRVLPALTALCEDTDEE